MKSPHSKTLKEKIKNLFERIRSVKNLEIILAAILAAIAILAYIGITFSGRTAKTASSTIAQMTEREKRLSETISRIEGVGECSALITTGDDKEILGVIVVAEGAKDMSKKVQIIRCVEIATGATVDRIQVYQMANGG